MSQSFDTLETVEFPPTAVARVVARTEEHGADGEVALDRGTFQTLMAIDGRRTVAQVVEHRGHTATLEQLARLVDLGLVRVEMPQGGPTTDEVADAGRGSVGRASVPAQRQDAARAGGHGGPPHRRLRPAVAVPGGPSASADPCPRLGLVVNPSTFQQFALRHSLRLPSQLHRCFAGGDAEQVSTQEQVRLCLSDRFSTCPRFVDAAARAAALERAEAGTAVDTVERPRAPVRGGAALRRLPVAAGVAMLFVAVSLGASVLLVSRGSEARMEADSREVGAPSAHIEPDGPLSIQAGPAAPEPISAAAALIPKAAPSVPTLTPIAAPPQLEPPSEARAPSAEMTAHDPLPVVPAFLRPGHRAPMRTLLEETFARRPSGWPNDPHTTAWFADGAYRIHARWPDRFVAIGAPIATPAGEPLRDVIVVATLRKVGGPAGGGYGVIVRDQGPGPRDGLNQGGRYYVLEAGDLGEFGVWRRDDNRWTNLVPWMPNSAIRPGRATNELMAMAIGPQLTFLVNGVQVARLTDPTLGDGGVGVFVGGDLNDVVLERFAVHTVE